METLSGDPTLEELREIYPAEWATVERDIARLTAGNDDAAIKKYLQSLAATASPTAGRRRSEKAMISAAVRRRMAAEVFSRAYTAAASGAKAGERIRFNLVNGYIAQKLLFRRDLERKPVSLPLFRLIWPMLPQRRLLMPLVTKKGIYCFYTRQLVTALADLIGDRTCLEIGAGDGTLSRFLTRAGVAITATDDHSWKEFITYPADVVKQTASTALKTHKPAVVICSWPPPGNTFERHVFATPSVETYVVMASAERASAGDWETYERQTAFDLTHDETLSRMILPPEIDPAVYVFERKTR